MRVKLVSSVGFTPEETIKLIKATELLEKVWNSHEFEYKVLNFSFPYKPHWWSSTRRMNNFRMSAGLSNQGVYEKLMKCAERLDPIPDEEMEIELTIDRRNAGDVLGYTYSSTRMQWIYASFFGRATLADIAGNLAHEYCHKLGFEHEFERTSTRQYTVPYGVGYIVKELAVTYGKA